MTVEAENESLTQSVDVPVNFSFLDGIKIYRPVSFDSTTLTPFSFPKASKRNLLKDLRCEEIKFIPHIHATHIETKYHIYTQHDYPEENTASYILPLEISRPLLTMMLPLPVIDFERLKSLVKIEEVQFVILKIENPKISGFEGIDKNIIYNLKRTVPKLKVIGTNEPSIDPEYDEGRLEGHKAFFEQVPSGYVVELLNLESENIAYYELYMCLLNIFRLDDESDAYPCSPILYPLH